MTKKGKTSEKTGFNHKADTSQMCKSLKLVNSLVRKKVEIATV